MLPRKKHLALVFYDLGLGGIQQKIVDIVNYIYTGDLKKDIDIHVFFAKETAFTMRSKFVPSFHNFIIPQGKLSFLQKKYFLVVFFWAYKIWLLPTNIFLTHIFQSSVTILLLSKLFFWKKISVYISQDNIFTMENPGKIKLWMGRIFYPMAEKIFVQNSVAQYDLINNLHLSVEKVIVIPNWTLSNVKTQYEKKIDVLYVGRFESQKNLKELLEVIGIVVKSLPNIKVCFVGAGSQLRKLKIQCNQLNIQRNVRFFPPSNQIQKWYGQAKIFCLTSLYEGQPLVLLEAMQAGILPVIKNYPGLREYLLHKKTGIIVNNSADMAKQIIFYLTHYQARKMIAKQAKLSVKRNYGEQNLRRYLYEMKLC